MKSGIHGLILKQTSPLYMRNFRYLTFLLLALPFISFSQFRKYTNEFLNIGSGARGLSMGNAQSASVSDATAGYWNPAMLTSIESTPNLAIMHADYFGGIAKYDMAALALPDSAHHRTLGLTVIRFAVDDIPNTLYLVEPDGSINENNIQAFSAADYALFLSYAQRWKQWRGFDVSLGANAKIIYRKVGDFAKAWGFGLDAALALRSKRWQVGAVLRDATTTFNAWSFQFTDREKQVLMLTNNLIPEQSTELTAPRLLLGGSYRFVNQKNMYLLGELNLDCSFDGRGTSIVQSKLINVDPRLGMELGIRNQFFLRAGVSNVQQTLADADTMNLDKTWIYQPSLGAGFRLKRINLDYAFTQLANQGNPLFTHVFSLSIFLPRSSKIKSSN
jgi:hypothetical protein